MNSRRRFLTTSGALSGGLVLGALSLQAEPAAAVTGEADIWKVFAGRRSVRKFKSTPIPEADLLRILDAARSAPTSGNQQPWKFLAVREPGKIKAMQDGCIRHISERSDEAKSPEARQQFENKVRARLSGYFSAPTYIVVLTDNTSQYPDYNHWDGPLAAGYLILAARALGYGTVFITDVIPDSVTKDVLHIPEKYSRVCIIPLGIPVDWPERPSKRKLEEFIAYETI